MEPMDIAMQLLKMPPMWYADSDPQAPENKDFTMLQDFGHHPVGYDQTWESDDGVARGIAVPNHNDGTWGITHFEIADDLQGLGVGQEYLERFIDELREDEHPHEEGFHPYDEKLKPYDVHVVQVEPHAEGFWNKMVDRGVLHGAHGTGWIRENPEGTHYYTHAGDRDKLVAKSTQPLYDGLTSANTMKPFERSFMLLKSDGFIDNLVKMGKEQDAMQMQAMRQFVLENENSSDPAMREAAEEMYQYLTELMSHLGSDRMGESPQMPQVAGFNAPPPTPPRPVMADSAQANRPPGVPPEHPMVDGDMKTAMQKASLSKATYAGRSGRSSQMGTGMPGFMKKPQERRFSAEDEEGEMQEYTGDLITEDEAMENRMSHMQGRDKEAGPDSSRQSAIHSMMREMEQGKKDGAPEPPITPDEHSAHLEHKNTEALAQLFGMKPKVRTLGDHL